MPRFVEVAYPVEGLSDKAVAEAHRLCAESSLEMFRSATLGEVDAFALRVSQMNTRMERPRAPPHFRESLERQWRAGFDAPQSIHCLNPQVRSEIQREDLRSRSDSIASSSSSSSNEY